MHLLTATFLLFTLNAHASPVVDFNFDQLRNCQGDSGYEEVFLFTGREESEHLVRDSEATALVATLRLGRLLVPVTEVYSIALSPRYSRYEDLKGRVERIAIVMVEANQPRVGREEYPYDLLLLATEGVLKGTIFASHPATFDLARQEVVSVRFRCVAGRLAL